MFKLIFLGFNILIFMSSLTVNPQERDNYSIVFYSERSGTMGMVYQLADDNLYRLPVNNGHTYAHQCSQDGRYLAIHTESSSQILDFEFNSQITVDYPDSLILSISNNANSWIYRKYGESRSMIHVANSDGEDRISSFENGSILLPALSPDGSLVVFSSSRDSRPNEQELYVADVMNGGIERVTFSGGVNLDPSWSPDGTQILFSHGDRGSIYRNIYLMNLDGSAQVQLTDRDGGNYQPRFSPDGDKTVFLSIQDGNSDIYLINLDTSITHRLTDHPALDDSPCWLIIGETANN